MITYFYFDEQPKMEKELYYACTSGNLTKLNELIELCGVNFKGHYGYTALIYVTIYKHKEMCELLIEKGADINAKNNDGYTALHYTSRGAYKEICELLIEKGADINAKNNDGYTALIYASKDGHKEICELLIEKGAYLEISDYTFDIMLENKWIDLCMKIMRHKSFERRKHLIDYYYSFDK